MKREIKFRAWSDELKEWRYPVLDITNNMHKQTYLILEEFIGMKDKKGNEIYEGDIVISDNKNVFVIVRSIDFVGFRLKSDKEYKLHYEYSLEIIGNIHENPELLKS